MRVNKWESIPDMLTSRMAHELIALDNCIYALGGYLNGSVISAVEKFDVKTQHWREVPPMLERRQWFGAISKNE